MSPELTDALEKRFHTSGMPMLEVENPAGETRVRAGDGPDVVVRARKRAYSGSAEGGRRLLENLEVEMRQEGDEIRVSQRAYMLERGWMNVFREHRAVVDYDIELPRSAVVRVRSASGEIFVDGIEGPIDLQTVSGDMKVTKVQGPLRMRTVSGDAVAEHCAGALDGNTVSGDLRFQSCAWPSAHLRTISGDVAAEVVLGSGSFQITTISGDIELVTPSAFELRFDTTSGDLESAGGVSIEKTGRRAYMARQGDGGPQMQAHTVSGDVTVRGGAVDAPEPRDVPGAPEPSPSSGRDPKADALEVLQALERGEIDADEAARRLDAVRR